MNATSGWIVSGASVVGRDHVVLGRSAQDALAAGATGDAAWGVVCDGCGEGAQSEVGAGLAAAFLGAELERRIGSGAPPAEVPEPAIRALVALLADVTSAVAAGDRGRAERFVRDHLLATVVGFCARGDDGVVFACGDGAFTIDGAVTVIDEDGRPSYPAYAVLSAAAAPFVVRAFSVRPGARIAVATDGFDPALVPDAFGRPRHALRRWMNLMARAGHFRDDATIVTAERAA